MTTRHSPPATLATSFRSLLGLTPSRNESKALDSGRCRSTGAVGHPGTSPAIAVSSTVPSTTARRHCPS
jgi:hypothetical protein